MELNKIYNEDCLVGIKKIPSKTIDLIVSDPPYIIDNSGGVFTPITTKAT